MEDYITILRQLWRGETVNYNGPLGTFRNLSLGTKLEIMPPIIMAAMGDKTCEWAGRICDGVIYNSLWSPAAARRSTQAVRRGAVLAGRDPNCLVITDVDADKLFGLLEERLSTLN